MKKFKLFLSLFLLTVSSNIFAQSKTGQVYLIRSTGFEGSAVNHSFYLDDVLICKLKNQSYSIQDVPVGDHKISVVSGGLSNGKKSTPIVITVVEGKPNFVEVVSTKKEEYSNQITAVEILKNSADPILSKAKQITNCLH